MADRLLTEGHLTGSIQQLGLIGIERCSAIEGAIAAVGVEAHGLVTVVGLKTHHISRGRHAGVIQRVVGVGNIDGAHLAGLR